MTSDVDAVTKRWIIVHEPGLVPEKKVPHPQSAAGEEDFLIQLALCRPEGTSYTVARLTWDHDLWVSDGGEELSIARSYAPRKFARRVREVANRNAGWLKAAPARVKLVSRGRLP